ncbi:hypothetical protein QBC35DRAFT_279927 [Podospora australis]|uniref:Uncharacterized protein n=1 Tax=Podospora australis TaxID=1536484 RepID=A0AAN7ALT2_9PEZI|nr:hypothetical protein QBC35DRAFT_279927 [Podospora australis]
MSSSGDRHPSHFPANLFPAPIPAPEVFGRPMDPVPAPLVFINGYPGVGKEAVAECLTLLLGREKSLLVDVRSVGLDGDDGRNEKHKPLLTPEHPRYYSFDFDLESCALEPSSSSLEQASKDSTESESPFTASCSGANLIRLLSHPSNTSRMAVLAVCAPDTLVGRTTVRVLENAASQSGRLFIPITLECAPAENLRRAINVQRQCSYKVRRTSAPAVSGPAPGLAHDISNVVSGRQRRELARPTSEGLTLDVTSSALPFEAALSIIDFVKGCMVERDTELCSSSSSATTPSERFEGEKEWRVSG